MKRILLLVAVASMLATAMAHSRGLPRPKADPADAQCAKLAIKTLGPSFNPSNYTFFGGNEVSNEFSGVKTEGPDVFCGFGGPDFISSGPSFISLDAGDIFLGGAGDDGVDINRGTFYGEEGDDSVTSNEQGATFNGEACNDFVEENGGRFVAGEGCDDVMFGDDPVDPPEGSCTI